MAVGHPVVAVAISDVEFARTIQDSASVAAWARAIALQHGIAFMAGSVDIFANAVSRLSDLDVQVDEVEQLLLALGRRGIITNQQRCALHGAYVHRGSPIDAAGPTSIP